MELLQSRRYKYNPESMADYYFYDLKLVIDQIIELCKEGEFSVDETFNIILNEENSSGDFENDLRKMLRDLEIEISLLPIYSDDENTDIWKSIYKDNILMLLEDLKTYQTFIRDAVNEISKLFIKRKDYEEKRKLKIKQKIIQDGLSSLTKNYQSKELPSPEKNNTPEITTYEEKINNGFLQYLENFYPHAYSAVINGIRSGIIQYKNTFFNFKCDKGCVGLIFHEAGCSEWKTLNRFILINNEAPKADTLKNCTKNRAPNEWERIKPIFFPATPK
ncbi:MAG: hypothetical protein FWC19_10315 [Treponema sp.]|nr:hypothetical protein [Treponema sp.]